MIQLSFVLDGDLPIILISPKDVMQMFEYRDAGRIVQLENMRDQDGSPV